MKRILTVICLLSLSACSMAEHYTPVVDTEGVDINRYNAALATCRAKTAEVDLAGESLTSGAQGAVLGAALGAALGALSGHAGGVAALGAVTGVGGAGISKYSQTQDRQIKIINNCLKKRGFDVLG